MHGEVCTRGPNVMKGYWSRPEATAAAIDADGWFHTGDVGYLDDDGFLYIADRVKDMVITGGENVYPAEVEGVAARVPRRRRRGRHRAARRALGRERSWPSSSPSRTPS